MVRGTAAVLKGSVCVCVCGLFVTYHGFAGAPNKLGERLQVLQRMTWHIRGLTHCTLVHGGGA